MSDKVLIKVSVRTNRVGSDHSTEFEWDREEWEAMTDAEREQECLMAMYELIEWTWSAT